MEDLKLILDYLIFPVIGYMIWVHNKVIGNEKAIAVNAAKDSSVESKLSELSEAIKALTKEFHDYIINSNK